MSVAAHGRAASHEASPLHVYSRRNPQKPAPPVTRRVAGQAARATAALPSGLPAGETRTGAQADAAQAPVSFRLAVRRDVAAIHALITAHVAEGHLLPRGRADISRHVGRFVVATQLGRIVACADLAPIGRTVAELRSVVVDARARSAGVGTRLIDLLAKRAASEGRHTLCAFTHAPQYFVDKGFTVVPHGAVPEKIEADCRTCSQFGRCGQSAVVLPLSAEGRAVAAQAAAAQGARPQVSLRHV